MAFSPTSRLMGSTALVTAALIASPAVAQIELTISGGIEFSGGFYSGDSPPGSTDYDFESDAEIRFLGRGVTDNGLVFGGEIDLDRSDTGTGEDLEIDEAFVFLSGRFGEIRIGNVEGAAEEMRLTVPTIGGGGVDGTYGDFITGLRPDEATTNFEINQGDASRVRYISPTFSGFRIGFGFAPSVDDGLEPEPTPDYSDQIDVGLSYSTDASWGGVLFGAGISTSDARGAHEDPLEFGFGVRVEFRTAAIGGFYIDAGDGGEASAIDTGDLRRWGVGLTYSADAFVEGLSLGISYAGYEDDRQGVAGGDDEGHAVALSGAYALAPGLELSTDLVYFGVDNGTNPGTGANLSQPARPAGTNDGVVVVTSVSASF